MNNTTLFLLGDSITAGFPSKKHLPNINILNYAVSGDSTVECLDRISAEWFSIQPDAVFLCIGTNDFARERTDENILENIQAIVTKIGRYVEIQKIHITSIFPTRENILRPNERIQHFNVQLEQLSKKIGCCYFHLHKYFIDSNGMLKKEFTDDGLHLTESAYILWSNVLSEYITKNILKS